MQHPPPPVAPRFERLPLWKNAWRLAVSWLLGVALFLVYLIPIGVDPEGAPQTDAAGALILLDLVVGHLVLVLVAFRRRSPVVVAVVAMALTSVSVFGVPAAFLAALSLATRRRLAPVVAVGVLNLVGGLVFERVVVPWTMPAQFHSMTGQGWVLDLAVYTVFVVLSYGVVVLIGWNLGSRRELVASWREQADTANREQAARVAQAQLAERARIAREMHDVLAHRLSLVAMHAGVLAHRPDLSEQERAEAAEVVRSGTHQALEELRQVLGVLRAVTDVDEGTAGAPVEAPQPGLSGIPSLVAEATSSGQEVRLVADEELWARSVGLPAGTGRHAYRLVQEALTNARKHAVGEPVTVQTDGAPGTGLSLVVRNRTTPREATLPSGGRGLAGMAERVQLAGGIFEAVVEASSFVVRVHLPWPVEGGSDG